MEREALAERQAPLPHTKILTLPVYAVFGFLGPF
jgi:hypothetical protein